MKEYGDIGKENSAAERIAPECFRRFPFLLLDLLPWRWPYIQMDNSCVNANATARFSTVEPVYAKYYDERNFWSFTRAFSIFPAVLLFASSRKRGFFPTALFYRDVAWMREHDVINSGSSSPCKSRFKRHTSDQRYKGSAEKW